jgi:protein TonB
VSLGRKFASGLFAGLGTLLVFSLVLSLNNSPIRPKDNNKQASTTFEVKSIPKKKPPKKKRQKKKKKTNHDPPPTPILGSDLSGLSFGLDNLSLSVDGDSMSLIGDTTNVVMTSESVDEPPLPVHRVAPKYPEKARRKGITGNVTISLLVSNTGAVKDTRIVNSQPAGVFEESAINAVRQWRFQPAIYKGAPVAIRVTLPMSFGFEQ